MSDIDVEPNKKKGKKREKKFVQQAQGQGCTQEFTRDPEGIATFDL